MEKRVRVLILSEVCNPEWASLPGFSYSLAKAIAEKCDVTLVTHIRNKPALEKVGMGSAEIIYIDNEYIAGPMHRLSNLLRRIKLGGWMANMASRYLPYIEFERLAWKKCKPAVLRGDFDVIHRISPVSPTLPSPIAKWSPIPFILGPINGGLPWPAGFKKELRRESEFLIYLRSIYRLLPYYHSSYYGASRVLSAFPHADRDIPTHDDKIIRYDELGIDPSLFKEDETEATNNTGKLTFLFVGRLVAYKNPDVVIQAFLSGTLKNQHELLIVGDGPEAKRLKELAKDAGDSIKFLGWRSLDEVAQIMKSSDIFVFPTIREVGGNVILEAMACGLPCIVPEYGGPATLVDADRGIKVPISTKEALIRSFSQEMEHLATDHELREKLSQNAKTFALNEYSWESKARKAETIYNSILSQNADQ